MQSVVAAVDDHRPNRFDTPRVSAAAALLDRQQCGHDQRTPTVFCPYYCTVNAQQGCSGAGTRWNAVPANILEPERRSGKYRWPKVER